MKVRDPVMNEIPDGPEAALSFRYHCDARTPLASVLIRDLDERTIERLKTRASRNGRSLQAELRMLVERAAAVDVLESREIAARIRKKLGGRKHSDSAALLADDRRR